MAAYRNAKEILPPELLREVQRYVQGVELYIPRARRGGWGTKSGLRDELEARNARIRALFQGGQGLEELAHLFHLSYDTVRKIVYAQERRTRGSVPSKTPDAEAPSVPRDTSA